MRHVFLSLFALALAAVAAIAATTAMLNAPVRTSTVAAIPVNAAAPATPPTTAAPPASDASKPDAPKPDTAKPAGAAAGTAAAGKDTKEEEADEDPYAGIAPEELPPDLQYSADSSVSFPHEHLSPPDMYGLHFDHHTLSIARDGELLASEPLAVEIAAKEPRFGRAALAVARGRPDLVSLNHWRELGRADEAARSVAIEVAAHLRALNVTERVDAVVAVPADLDAGALMRLRGALNAAGCDARDFVDAATITAAAVTERAHYVILEAGWRSATATRVSGGAECAFEEAFVSERANLLDVYDAWLVVVAGAMVRNTRFDPLLSLDVEQRLYADLPLVAARAASENKVEAAVDADGARFAVEVDAQLFADAAQPFYRELMRLARSARIAGQGAALVLPAESRRWPGFLPRLHELEQDGLVVAPAGLAAVAASLRGADPAVTPRLRRNVARIADHALAANVEYVSSVAASPSRALPVTHILFGGDSMRFPDVGLVIGTEEVSNEPHIALPRAAAGVSRRHCSLRREGERTVLIDHSRHGTWVNGARVRERAPVRPGDRVRVGTPGVEFTLISAAAFGAAP